MVNITRKIIKEDDFLISIRHGVAKYNSRVGLTLEGLIKNVNKKM